MFIEMIVGASLAHIDGLYMSAMWVGTRWNSMRDMERCISWDDACGGTQMATEKLRSELSATWEKQKAVQGEQKLKQKQIALLMQSLADVQAAVHEVRRQQAGMHLSSHWWASTAGRRGLNRCLQAAG